MKTCIELDHLPKIQKWVSLKKYLIDETVKELKLSIQIFNYSLRKSGKSDADLIRDELNEIKKEKQHIVRDTKLFIHYFFSFWTEKARDSLLSRDYLLEQIVDSP